MFCMFIVTQKMCASKGGVTLLTKSLAVELAERKIEVEAITGVCLPVDFGLTAGY